MKVISFKVEDELADVIEIEAKKRGIGRSQLLRQILVQRYLEFLKRKGRALVSTGKIRAARASIRGIPDRVEGSRDG